jgi:uncharacterized protein (TIGR02099 family)
MSSAAAPSELPAPRSALQRSLRISLFSLLAIILLIAMGLAAFSLAMAQVPAYRAQMQAWISERAKLHIQFDSLRAGWRGYGPELVFTQATLRSVDRHRVIAVAEQGSVGFDLWQALRSGRLSAARFRLEGTELKLQRDQDGGFAFIGQADWPEFATDSSFKLDSLPVGELVIRRVTFSFRDLKTGRGPWTLQDVSLDINRDARQFTVQGRAELPQALGKQLRFHAQGKGNLNTIAELDWQAAVQGTEFDLAGWKQVMPDDWPAPATGTGSFQLSATLKGARPQQFTGSVNFVDVSLLLPEWQLPLPHADPLQQRADDPDLKTARANTTGQNANAVSVNAAPASWQYSNVALQFDSHNTQAGWLTQFSNVQLARATSPWPAGTASVLLKFVEQHDASRRLAVLETKAQVLVLENMWPLLAYLPETAANAHLRALHASGQLRNLAIRYQQDAQESGQLNEPRFGMQLEFAQLGLAPVGKMPGVTGLSGTLAATGARGSLQLDSSELALSIPRIFRTPLPLDRVTGNVVWTRNTQGVQLQTDNLVIDNADGKARAKLALTVPYSGTATIDMQATAEQLQLAAAPRYMPAGIMRKRTLAWFDAAFPVGKVISAQATLRGPLNKFPYRHNEGEFLLKAQLEGLTMQYQESWLPATNLQVAAEFRNAGLTAVVSAGRMNGMYLDHAEGRIKDYRDAEFFITARGHGELAQGLSFVQQSPVGPAIGDLFQRVSGKGVMQVRSELYLPLRQFKKRKIDIDVTLADATVGLMGLQQVASQVQGSLRITNDAITGADLRGNFLQGAFKVSAEPLAAGRYNLVANGKLQAQPLMQFLNLPKWIKLSGSTDYRYVAPGYAQRNADGVRHLYSVYSTLQGLQIDLPAPIHKSPEAIRSLQIDADMPRKDSLQLRGSMGDLRTLVRLQQSKNVWQFERAGLRVDGGAAALPAHTGLRIDGRIASFTLDDWLRLGNDTDKQSNAKLINPAGTRLQDILRAANVTIDRFYLYGFEWPSLRAVLQATEPGWRVDVAGEQATGQVLVPYVFSGAAPLTLNMDSLWLTPATEGMQASNGRTSIDPRGIPAIRADIGHFRYGVHDFGALQATATRATQGLQVESLRIHGNSFNGTGSGSWLQTANGSRNTLAFTLDSHDVRATLQQFNYGDFIAAKRGKLVANLQWPDGLDENLLGRASGTLTVQADEGQLLSVEPGAGRVLGLLSIAALPRRLGLDFHDITDQGLAFDTVHADFAVTNGDARTQNLLLRGSTAEIGIVGRLGLGVRDYDQTAVVTGNVSGALPVAAVVAGGPVVGAAMLLFSQVFKEPLKGVARAYYRISGSWDAPQVERIDADAAKASLSAADSSSKP